MTEHPTRYIIAIHYISLLLRAVSSLGAFGSYSGYSITLLRSAPLGAQPSVTKHHQVEVLRR